MKVGDPSETDVAVDFVAVVDEPAIQQGWMKFSAIKCKKCPECGKECKNCGKPFSSARKEFRFEVADKERRIITGPLMIADLPIYRRNDELGEFMVVFRKAEIEKIVKKFAKGNFFNNVNKMHDDSNRPGGIYLMESMLIDKSRGILTPALFDEAPDGSWFASYYVENDELWKEIKAGTFKGFSVQGFFDMAMGKQKEPEPSDLERGLIALANIM